MRSLIKLMVYGAAFLGITSCMSFKPFQPNPPQYMSWVKAGTTEEEVKQTMRDCGYKNLYGYGGPVASEDEVAKREICMFAKGFRYKSGYKGICSLKSDPPIVACKDYTNPNLRP